MSAALHYLPVTDELLQEAEALCEEPEAFIAHVRVCRWDGWVTAGSTRQPTPYSLRCGFQARLTSGVHQHQHMQIRRHA